MLDGRLDFLVNLRLSDYLRQQAGYLVVRDGEWRSREGASGRRWPIVVVNPGQVLGIVESEQQQPGTHPGRLNPAEWGA